MPETTIPADAAVMRALGAWLGPGGGPDEQDALVELLVRVHAHADYHPADPADLGDTCKILVAASTDDTDLWPVVNGAAERPCTNRLSAHGRLLDTPPAVPGDKDGLCRGCREAETRRVFGDAARAAARHLPEPAPDPDRALAAIHAAGAELLGEDTPAAVGTVDPDDDPGDDESRAARFRAAAHDAIRRLPTPAVEALHDAAGAGGGPIEAGTISVGGGETW